MNIYYRHMAEDLGQSLREMDDLEGAIKEICVVLGIVPDIPETHFRMYTECLDVDQVMFRNMVAYFAGLGKINVICDCEEDAYLCDTIGLHSGPHYDHGREERMEQSGEWQEVTEQIESIAMEIK